MRLWPTLTVGAPLITSEHLVVACAVTTIALTTYGRGTKWSKKRRETKAVIAGKDKTALEEIATKIEATDDKVDTILGILITPDPTPLVPYPPAGIIEQVADHGRMLKKLLPNGGNTDDPGDLLLKMARKQGVTEDTESAPSRPATEAMPDA